MLFLLAGACVFLVSCGSAWGMVAPVTPPPLPSPLRNTYFALRHGQSVANMEGVISSNPAIGTVKHGLTASGRQQARSAATCILEACGRNAIDDVIFVSSDFVRARETAEECRAALQRLISFEREAVGEAIDLPDVLTEPNFRERYFGALDGHPLSRYNEVWPRDLEDASSSYEGVERVTDVAIRLRDAILRLEDKYEGKQIIVSSHADTLQILQCYVGMVDLRIFSQFRFKNGEVRRLMQDPSSMPDRVPLTFK